MPQEAPDQLYQAKFNTAQKVPAKARRRKLQSLSNNLGTHSRHLFVVASFPWPWCPRVSCKYCRASAAVVRSDPHLHHANRGHRPRTQWHAATNCTLQHGNQPNADFRTRELLHKNGNPLSWFGLQPLLSRFVVNTRRDRGKQCETKRVQHHQHAGGYVCTAAAPVSSHCYLRN